jgi:hypothetical protein
VLPAAFHGRELNWRFSLTLQPAPSWVIAVYEVRAIGPPLVENPATISHPGQRSQGHHRNAWPPSLTVTLRQPASAEPGTLRTLMSALGGARPVQLVCTHRDDDPPLG